MVLGLLLSCADESSEVFEPVDSLLEDSILKGGEDGDHEITKPPQ